MLLNNFQTILYRLKEGEKKKKGKERKRGERAACVRELSGGCHVGLLCSAYTRPPHEFMSLKMQKKSRSVLNVCMGFYSCALEQDLKFPSAALFITS